MSRCAALTGSASLIAALLATPALAWASDTLTYTFGGEQIAMTQVRSEPQGPAIAVDDPGLTQLLGELGATVTWRSGERYILITTAEPLVIGFAVGDRQYDVGPVAQTAPFAPFVEGGHAYVPLDQLLSALDLAPKNDSGRTVLQPQLAGLDVQTAPSGAKVVAHAGVPLDWRVRSQSSSKIAIEFDGVGTALQPNRTLQGDPISRIELKTEGSISAPRTVLVLWLSPGAPAAVLGTDDQRDFTAAFGTLARQNAPAPQARPEQPVAQTSSTPSAPAQSGVTAVRSTSANGGAVVRIDVSGNPTYEWHRLLPPDNRWWIDLHGVTLSMPEQSTKGSDPISGIRVRQQAGAVRVALSLTRYNAVAVTSDATGITITVSSSLAQADAPRSGPQNNAGSVQTVQSGASAASGRYVAANPRLIVIDPGHGGSDTGAIRGDAVEKVLTLDVAKRVRDILSARGWQVVMTRQTDRDVYAADDSAHDELQARDDIANGRGARLFVSIHVNSFMNAGPHGATVYYYKAIDLPLAEAVDRRIAQQTIIKDDGIVKDKLYVVHHANMPATLVETAYLSNPDDLQLLESPDWRQKMARAIADGIQDYAGAPSPNLSNGQ